MVGLSEAAVYFSKGNNPTASTLKTLLRENGHDLVYVKSVGELLDIMVKQTKGLIFVDKGFSVYRYLFKELADSSELFSASIIIYVDNNKSKYEKLENQKNYFRIDESFCRTELFNVLGGYVRTEKRDIIDTCQLNEELSMYLMKLGFSPRLIGFNYIKCAIIGMVKNDFKMGTLQNDVYKLISTKYKTQSVNIERNICSSIKHALKNTPDLHKTLNIPQSNRLTCKELLAVLLDKTQICLKSGKKLHE